MGTTVAATEQKIVNILRINNVGVTYEKYKQLLYVSDTCEFACLPKCIKALHAIKIILLNTFLEYSINIYHKKVQRLTCVLVRFSLSRSHCR